MHGGASPREPSDTPAPPAGPRLAPIPRPYRPLLGAFWLLCFALALTAQGGGLWLGLSDLGWWDMLAGAGTGLAAAIALLAVSALLVRRDPGDPVSLLLSLSCLSAAAYLGPATLSYSWLEMELVATILPSLWMGFLVAALPAFPDGRFVPSWGRWLTLLALPFTLAIAADAFTEDEGVILATTLLGFGVGLAALATSVIRYRRLPAGLAKQQLKWAALGIGGGFGLLILAILLAYAAEAELFPEDWLPWLQIAYSALHDIAFAWLALGLLVALLRLRLWDADRAIGRTAGYFVLTLVLACVWAVSSALVNDLVAAQVGAANKGANAAIGTLIAVMVFGPARERVNKWMEGRFQRGVVRLRKLPDKLRVWQHLDDPADFGGRVVASVEESLHAGSAAVLLFEDDRFRVLATHGLDQAEVESWMAAQGSFSALEWEDREDGTFPLRMILTDEDVLIGALLVGRRSDGSFYAKPERKTLFGLEPPLAAALHRVQRRTLSNQAVDHALAELDERLGRVEETVQPH